MPLVRTDEKTLNLIADVCTQVKGSPVTAVTSSTRKGQNPYAVTRLCRIGDSDIEGRDDADDEEPTVHSGKAIFYYKDSENKLKKMDGDTEVDVFNLGAGEVKAEAWAMAVYIGGDWFVNFEDCNG